jgi:chaperonin cofactor prefoldin
MQDFSKVNANDFTQKDLMLHLLNVTQHSATREDVKSDILELSSQVDKRFEQVDKRFEQVDKRFEQVDKRFEQVDKRFDKVEAKIDKVDVKFDRLQWLIVATIVTVLGKDYILSLF